MNSSPLAAARGGKNSNHRLPRGERREGALKIANFRSLEVLPRAKAFLAEIKRLVSECHSRFAASRAGAIVQRKR